MTQEFKTSVDSNNVAYVRMMLSNELILDPRGASFEEMLAYAKQKLPNLLEKDVPSDTTIPTDKNIWDMHVVSTMKRILNKNFSVEKLTLYIEMAKYVGADKAKKMENKRSIHDNTSTSGQTFTKRKCLSKESLTKLSESVAQTEINLKSIESLLKNARAELKNLQKDTKKLIKKSGKLYSEDLDGIETQIEDILWRLQGDFLKIVQSALKDVHHNTTSMHLAKEKVPIRW